MKNLKIAAAIFTIVFSLNCSVSVSEDKEGYEWTTDELISHLNSNGIENVMYSQDTENFKNISTINTRIAKSIALAKKDPWKNGILIKDFGSIEVLYRAREHYRILNNMYSGQSTFYWGKFMFNVYASPPNASTLKMFEQIKKLLKE